MPTYCLRGNFRTSTTTIATFSKYCPCCSQDTACTMQSLRQTSLLAPSGTDASDLRHFAQLRRYLSAPCYFRTSATTNMVQLHADFTVTLHLQQHLPCGCQSALFRPTALTHVTLVYCATASGQVTSPSVPQTCACHCLATRLL